MSSGFTASIWRSRPSRSSWRSVVEERPWAVLALPAAARRARHLLPRAPRATGQSHRAQRRLPRHRAGARRRRPSRRQLHRRAFAGRRGARDGGRRARWASTPTSAATSSSARSCTTSARSPSRRRSSTSPASSIRPSGPIIRTHTVEGQRMLDRVGGFMRDVGLIVRSHHERWDGGGYPDGLSWRADPARSADRVLLRRVERDDDHAQLPRGDADRRRGRARCAAAPAPSSTLASSTLSSNASCSQAHSGAGERAAARSRGLTRPSTARRSRGSRADHAPGKLRTCRRKQRPWANALWRACTPR